MAQARYGKGETDDVVGTFEPVSTCVAVLGESPVWCPATKTVWWVD